jgi:hypothetical protein
MEVIWAHRGVICPMPGSLGQGTNLKNIAPEQFCHLPKNISFPLLMSIDVYTIPLGVELSQCTGVFGWGCPKSARVSLKMMPYCQFRRRAPSLASAADATRNFRIEHSVWNAPFSCIGLPFFQGKNVHTPGYRHWVLTNMMHPNGC